MRIDNAAIGSSLTNVAQQGERQHQALDSRLTVIQGIHGEQLQRLVSLEQRVREQQQSNSLAASAVRQSSQLAGQTNDMVSHLIDEVRRVKLLISNPTPRALDPTKDQPVTLEDPLGYCLTVPMDLIGGWEVGTITAYRMH